MYQTIEYTVPELMEGLRNGAISYGARLYVLQELPPQAPGADESTSTSNTGMAGAIRAIRERHEGLPHGGQSDTQKLISEARSGAMYGYDAAE